MPQHPPRENAAIVHFALVATIDQRRHTAISPFCNELASRAHRRSTPR